MIEKRKTRFIWLAPEIPFNPDSGQLIYSNGLLRGLLETGAQGVLIAFAREQSREYPLGLEVKAVSRPKRWRPLSLFSTLHSDAWRLRNEESAACLRAAVLAQPDIIVIDYFATGWALPIVREALSGRRRRPVLVYLAHNYESDLRKQVANSMRNPIWHLVLRIDAWKAARLERDLCNTCDLIVANTDEDKRRFEASFPGKFAITLSPAYDGDITATRPITAALPRKVLIVGAFDWIAKQTNLRRFLAAAQKPFQAAGIDLLVVGRAQRSFIEELTRKHPFCKFTGPVEDVRPFLSSARIGVMPDEVGGGFKHKYLYYIFSGLAVATFRSQTAGLPVNVDRDMIARDSLEGLVAGIVEGIDDIPRLEEMRRRCWEACAQAFSWTDRARRLRVAIEQISSH